MKASILEDIVNCCSLSSSVSKSSSVRFSLLFFKLEYLAIARPTTASSIRKPEGGGLTLSLSNDEDEPGERDKKKY